jgi:hypothetical protein
MVVKNPKNLIMMIKTRFSRKIGRKRKWENLNKRQQIRFSRVKQIHLFSMLNVRAMVSLSAIALLVVLTAFPYPFTISEAQTAPLL